MEGKEGGRGREGGAGDVVSWSLRGGPHQALAAHTHLRQVVWVRHFRCHVEPETLVVIDV